MRDFEFTDRYKALGIPYPDPTNMCHGQCDGVGVYPLYGPCEESGREATLWREAHDGAHSIRRMILELWKRPEWWYVKSWLRDMIRGFPCDGWHFVECPDCGGTGKRSR